MSDGWGDWRDLRVAIRLGAHAGYLFDVALGEARRSYELARVDHDACLGLLEQLAADFGMRAPLARQPDTQSSTQPAQAFPLRPILTAPVDPRILYGYGDPCVLRLPGREEWRLVVTSNDAPDAFPVLSSSDLAEWRLSGFVFPRGRTPAWCLTGEGAADFWAPEMHFAASRYVVCFAARERSGDLAIGLAFSDSPDGPYAGPDAPLLRGGVIDPHLHVDDEGRAWLFWKEDANDVWPAELAKLLHAEPGLIPRLFEHESDRRAAAFAGALHPLVRDLRPMERFFLLQALIEAAAADLDAFEGRLDAIALQTGPAVDPEALRRALRTRIMAARLSPALDRLEGGPVAVLSNDLPWERHLIEGVWVTRQAGRFHLLYSGNDFSTPQYGVGAAQSAGLLGPYRKRAEPLLRSTTDWRGPGHPSISEDAQGRPMIFLHAYPPGVAGYGAFRALLGGHIRFGESGADFP